MARLERILTVKSTGVVSVTCGVALSALLTGCNESAAARQPGATAATSAVQTTPTERKPAAVAVSADAHGPDRLAADEALLVGRALATHLDADPAVLQDIERARRQILARAYEERSILPHTQISATAQRDYYLANPALFAQRRIYRTWTFSVPRSALTPALRNTLDHAKSAIQVRQLLDRRHIAFEAVETTRPAEEIPMDMLPQLAQAAVGDVLIASPPKETHALLICLVGARSSPVDFEHASGPIRQYLTDVRNRDALVEYMARLRRSRVAEAD